MTQWALRLAPAVAADTTAIRKRITADSLWLSSGYLLTAGSGFIFWILAALWIPQTQLGIEASILSVVMAAAALASNGPGSALVVMLPLGGRAARSALVRAYGIATVLAATFGALAGVLVIAFLPTGMPAALVLTSITFCTVVWALFNTQTQALAGASDTRSTLIVNGSANVLKVSLLLVFALPGSWMQQPLVVATILPAAAATLLSIAVLVPRALRRADVAVTPLRSWDSAIARTFRLFTAQNAVAVGIVLCAGLSLSFLVTTLSAPTEGAIFAIAFQFSIALDLVGVSVATALARSAVAEFDSSAGLARGYAAKVVVVVGGLGLLATLATPVMFLIVGRGYPPLYGMAVVGTLAAASVIRPRYDIWSALVRAQHRVRPVLWSNALYVAILFGLVLLLVPGLGAIGAAIAVVVGAIALALIGEVALRRTLRAGHIPHLEGVV